jgi:uncharacterized membrane protein YgaE (UPF0421/DUF939 family)
MELSEIDLRDQLSAALARGRTAAWPVTQAAVASGLAWYLAHDALGHPQPFFAPIAAAISLSASVGRRWRNVGQMVLGVTLGIGVAEAVVGVAGPGVLSLTAVVLITMGLAASINSMPMFVNQAAASAVLVVALRTGGVGGERLIDAVIGGASALLISLVLFPPRPRPLLARAIRHALAGVARALAGAADALESRQPRDAEWMLATTHAVHAQLNNLTAARGAAADIVHLAPLHWRDRSQVERADVRAAHVALLANTALTLVRLAASVLDDPEDPPAGLAESVAELAHATSTLARGASPAEREQVRALIRELADAVPPSHGRPAVAATALELRAAATDLLRVIRDEDEEFDERDLSDRARDLAATSAEAARRARTRSDRSRTGARP